MVGRPHCPTRAFSEFRAAPVYRKHPIRPGISVARTVCKINTKKSTNTISACVTKIRAPHFPREAPPQFTSRRHPPELGPKLVPNWSPGWSPCPNWYQSRHHIAAPLCCPGAINAGEPSGKHRRAAPQLGTYSGPNLGPKWSQQKFGMLVYYLVGGLFSNWVLVLVS